MAGSPRRPPLFRQKIDGEGAVFRSRLTQPGETEILEQNRRDQQDTARRRSDFLRPLARVPVIVREKWRREGREDLLSGDRRVMERFLGSSEGKPYRVSPQGKSRSFSFGGIGNGKVGRTGAR